MKNILIDLSKAANNAECDYAIVIKQEALLNKENYRLTVIGEAKSFLTLKGFDNVEFLDAKDNPYEAHEKMPHYDAVFSLSSKEEIIDSLVENEDAASFYILKKRQCLLVEIPEEMELTKENLLSFANKIEAPCKNLLEKEEVTGKLLINDKESNLGLYENVIDYTEFMEDSSDFLLFKKKEWDLFSKGLKAGSTILYDFLFNSGNMNFRNAMGKLMFRNSYSFFNDSNAANLLTKPSYLSTTGTIYACFDGNPSEIEFKNAIKTLLLLTK